MSERSAEKSMYFTLIIIVISLQYNTVLSAVKEAVKMFGPIDILINGIKTQRHHIHLTLYINPALYV